MTRTPRRYTALLALLFIAGSLGCDDSGGDGTDPGFSDGLLRDAVGGGGGGGGGGGVGGGAGGPDAGDLALDDLPSIDGGDLDEGPADLPLIDVEPDDAADVPIQTDRADVSIEPDIAADLPVLLDAADVAVDQGPVMPSCPEDDPWEENDSFEEAQPIERNIEFDGVLCPGRTGLDEDFYRFSLREGCDLRVELNFNDDDGDLDMSLLDADEEVLLSSRGSTDQEYLELIIPQRGDYVLRIYRRSNNYNLKVESSCPEIPACPTDDPWEENDELGQAAALPEGTAVLCDEIDLYQIEGLSGCLISPSLSYSAGAGELNTRLLDAAGEELMASSEPNLSFDYEVLESGPLYLEISGDSMDYDLGFSQICDFGCLVDDPLEVGSEMNDAAPLAEEEEIFGIICGDDSDWFFAELHYGCLLEAVLEFDDGAGNLDLFLFNSAGEVLLSSETEADQEILDFEVRAPDSYYVQIIHPEGAEETASDYTLTWTQVCPERLFCPEDDLFEENDGLELAAEAAEGQEHHAILCDEADLYQLNPEGLCRVELSGQALGDGELDLSISDSHEVLFEGEGIWFLEPEEHFLSASGAGEYRFEYNFVCNALSCESDEAEGRSDDPESALPLVNGEQLQGLICDQDEDWYSFEAEAGCALRMTLFHEGTQIPGLELYLGEELLSTGMIEPEQQEIRLNTQVEGLYHLRVRPEEDGGRWSAYLLEMSLVCDGELSCPIDDALENNDEISTAAILPEAPFEGIICDQDADFFLIESEPECQLSLSLSFSHADADLDLQLLDAEGEELASSTNTEDLEEIEEFFPEAGSYYLRVYKGGRGEEALYQLSHSLECLPVLACPEQDDSYEPNDLFAEASLLNPGSRARVIHCPESPDYYALELGRGCQIQARLESDPNESTLSLSLVDIEESELASLETIQVEELLEFSVDDQPAAYALRVLGDVGQRYYLSYEVSNCPELLCPEDDLFEENDSLESAQALEAELEAVVCAEDQDWYQFDGQAGCHLRLGVEQSFGAISLEIWNGESLELLGSEGRFLQALEEDGPVYLRVSNAEGQPKSVYRLNATLICEDNLSCPADDLYEDNNGMDSATEMGPGALQGIYCGPDQDFFSFGAEAGCHVGIDLLFSQSDADLDLSVVDTDGNSLASAISGSDDEHLNFQLEESGEYFIKIYSFSGEVQAPYELALELQCLSCPEQDDSHEPDDAPDEAEPLMGGEGQALAIACAEDPDYYSVNLGAGCQLSAELSLSPEGLTWSLVNMEGESLAEPVEGVLSYMSMAEELVSLRVVGDDLEYGIAPITVQCAFCPGNDMHEPNESLDDASALETGVVEGILCEEDVDLYLAPIQAGCRLEALLESNGDLQLSLLGAEGEMLRAEAMPLSYFLYDEAPLYLSVEGEIAQPYFLDLALMECEALPECDAAEDDSPEGANLLEEEAEGHICAADRDHYSFEIPEECSGELHLLTEEGAPLMLLLLDEAGEPSQSDPVMLALAEPGSYMARVEGEFPDNSHAAYGLSLALECDFSFCGDGIQDEGEECDDGNNEPDDGCDPNCALEPRCGDGAQDEGEECDDGNNEPDDGCASNCILEPYCGDGTLDEGEECDDGNSNRGDGCSADCVIEPGCLDSFESNNTREDAALLETGEHLELLICEGDRDWYRFEMGPGCLASIDLSFTHDEGDVDAQLRWEDETVDSSTSSDDNEHLEHSSGQQSKTLFLEIYGYNLPAPYSINFSLECGFPYCGDGTQDEGEECDDGNNEPGDGCAPNCTLEPICGDGLRERGEECDDSNTEPGDGCGADCTIECMDAYEENNSRESAAPLLPESYTGLSLCEDDWYRVEVGAGCLISATLNFVHDDMDLDSQLYRGTELVDRSAGSTDLERLTHLSLEPETYFVKLYGFRMPGFYDLELLIDCEVAFCGDGSVDEGEECDDGNQEPGDGCDAHCILEPECDNDGLEPNNNRESAAPLLLPVEQEMMICNGESDWYSLTAFEGCQLNIELGFLHAEGDIDISVTDPVGNNFASRTSGSDNESISKPVTLSGDYSVRVYGMAEVNNHYGFRAWLSDCPQAWSCPGVDDEHEENDDLQGATPLTDMVSSAGIICLADRDYFSIDVAEGCALTALLTFSHAEGDLNLSLQDETGVELALSDSQEDGELLEWLMQADGTLYLEVLLEGDNGNTYELLTEQVCPEICPADDPMEENDTEEQTTPLAPDVRVEGVICGGDEDWFSFEAAEGCEIQVDLYFSHADGDLELDLYDSERRMDSSHNSENNERVAGTVTVAGLHKIKVLGYNEAENEYEIQLSLSCPEGRLVINELDYDEPGVDEHEFIEIYNAGAAPFPLEGVELQLINLNNPADPIYAQHLLSDAGAFLLPGAYLVIGDEAVMALPEGVLSLPLEGGEIENGPDHISLVDGTGEVLDSITYEITIEGVTEGTGDLLQDRDSDYALFRCLDGVDTDNNDADFMGGLPTPGFMNACPRPLECPGDDTFEENDDRLSAAPLAFEPVEGILCGADEDYFVFAGGADCTANIEVSFDSFAVDIDIFLEDATGLELASGEEIIDPELISHLLPSDGSYFLRLFLAEGAAGPYSVQLNLDCPPPEGQLLLNEVDYDQPNNDTEEFVEIFNAGAGASSLEGLSLQVISPALEVVSEFPLPVLELAPGGFFVLGSEAIITILPEGTPSIEFPAEFRLSNSATGLRLYRSEGEETLDSMSWEGFIEGITEGVAPAPTDAGTSQALVRCPNGHDNQSNVDDFDLQAPTPGVENTCIP